MATRESTGKWQSLKLQIKSELGDLINRAAKRRGKSRADFILDAAQQAAAEVLLDPVPVPTTARAYREFLTRLDRPAAPNARLRQTLQTPAPWDQT